MLVDAVRQVAATIASIVIVLASKVMMMLLLLVLKVSAAVCFVMLLHILRIITWRIQSRFEIIQINSSSS